MISKMSKVAAVAALAMLLWPTARANAVCSTGLSDTTNIDCKNAVNCQFAIHKDIIKYYTAVQTNAEKMINATQKGTTSKKPASKCIGGVLNGKACSTNNGLCASTDNKGKVCASDSDCVVAPVGGECDRSKQCNPGLCAGGTKAGAICKKDSDCPASTCSITNDANECQIDTAKSDYAKAIQVAQANLRKDVLKQCNTAPKIVDPTNLGLDQLSTCPGIASAPSADKAYDALLDCIMNSEEGDISTGKVVDTTIYAFAKATGTNALPPRGKKTDSVPRAVLQLAGAQILQVGTASAGSPVSSGGGLTLLSGASCGNGNFYCLGAKDCGNNGGGTADTCTPNSDTDPGCLSGNPCRTLTAPGPVHASDPPNGNILTVSSQCSGGVATCLVTQTQDANNGTPASGFINFTAGEVGTHAPIKTNVYITGLGVDCNTYVSCPTCDGTLHTCQTPTGQMGPAPANNNACTAQPNVPTQECLPNGGPAAVVPNPFTLSTEPKNMTANMGGQFCGFCDTSGAAGCQGGSYTCSNGCQANGDCASVTACSGGTNNQLACTTGADCPGGSCVAASVCDFGSSAQGFQGDTSVTSINADGVRNQYTPIATGIFCTGITGNGVIDSAAGLPGPVRVTIPYIQAYLYSTDP